MSRAWMPFYGGDFIGNTLHLSTHDIGAYVLLLWHAWEHGGRVPNNDSALARIARVHPPHWQRVRKSLEPLFDLDQEPGSWVSKRATKELLKAEKISSKRKAAAEQMHAIRRAKAKQKHTQSQSQSQKKNLLLNGHADDFVKFWLAYPRKVGKGQAIKAFHSAIQKTSIDVILAAIKSQQWSPDPKFQPHPATWLNGERWLDETKLRDNWRDAII